MIKNNLMKNNLTQRIITAAVLLPFVILGILYLPYIVLQILLAFVLSFAIWEWTKLSGFEKVNHRIGIFIVILITAILVNSALILAVVKLPTKISNIFLVLLLLFWIGIAVLIKLYPTGKRFLSTHWSNIVLGGLILGPAFLVMDLGINFGRPELLYVLFIVWFADIGAYFVGKKLGKHTLAPNVSPKKTWEGVLGGIAAALIIIIAGYFWFIYKDLMTHDSTNQSQFVIKTVFWFLTGIITAIFSIVGDLFISLLKRNRHLKDTGSLLPGHGGILDRIDGLLASLTVFAVLTLLQSP